MKLSNSRFEQIAAIVRKDFVIGLRRRATFAAMMMFALTAVASLSLSTGGIFVEAKFLAALLWVVIFFAASAGISGTFDDEAQAGTLPTLKLYADAQAILFGKMIYVLLSLVALTIFILPIFLILFDVAVENFFLLLATILLGLIGIAAAGTLTAALTTSATVKGGLFPILLFPITLPIFLPAISLTELSFTGGAFDSSSLVVMVAFDLILVTAASILYDYL
ncbi:MAG: heme exporter protein CcmB [Selenomonadaceae bacterium]|nr:heme exporter protein CcmB [Selenomonadaceae bacterium]MBQ4403376.1 heme exporter protein CcmB [Selenomonadaceae bacterium]